jgi:hypothetical protein
MTLSALAVGHSSGRAEVIFASVAVAAGSASQQVLSLNANPLANLERCDAFTKPNDFAC